MELTGIGFNLTVLSKFCERLSQDNAEHRPLDELLTVCFAKRLIKKRDQASTVSTHVLAKGGLNRLVTLIKTMRLAFNTLATSNPGWLSTGKSEKIRREVTWSLTRQSPLASQNRGAYRISDLAIDWDAKHVTCPNDKKSAY